MEWIRVGSLVGKQEVETVMVTQAGEKGDDQGMRVCRRQLGDLLAESSPHPTPLSRDPSPPLHSPGPASPSICISISGALGLFPLAGLVWLGEVR